MSRYQKVDDSSSGSSEYLCPKAVVYGHSLFTKLTGATCARTYVPVALSKMSTVGTARADNHLCGVKCTAKSNPSWAANYTSSDFPRECVGVTDDEGSHYLCTDKDTVMNLCLGDIHCTGYSFDGTSVGRGVLHTGVCGPNLGEEYDFIANSNYDYYGREAAAAVWNCLLGDVVQVLDDDPVSSSRLSGSGYTGLF